jgi:hypothetical protein
MNRVYSWAAAYQTAVLETNPVTMAKRIDETVKAIEDGLRGPLPIPETEQRAMEDAQKALAALKAERDGNRSFKVDLWRGYI